MLPYDADHGKDCISTPQQAVARQGMRRKETLSTDASQPKLPRATGSTTWAATLDYLSRGFSVIPIQLRAKRPLFHWREFRERRASAEEIREWFEKWPDANLAIVTGALSGVVVLDVDARRGGPQNLLRLERSHARLPPTLEAVTGSNGRYLYLAHPGRPLAEKTAIESGVDLLGDGGYAVAPPSIHPSGTPYLWRPAHSPAEIPIAAMPEWLVKAAAGSITVPVSPSSDWDRLAREGIAEGERRAIIASLGAHLFDQGVEPHVALDLLLCWSAVRCHPPLPKAEVEHIVENVGRLHAHPESGMHSRWPRPITQIVT